MIYNSYSCLWKEFCRGYNHIFNIYAQVLSPYCTLSNKYFVACDIDIPVRVGEHNIKQSNRVTCDAKIFIKNSVCHPQNTNTSQA